MKYLIALPIVLAATALSFSATAAEEWNGVSSSARFAYLADISSISTVGDDTTVNVARVPVQGTAGDYSHKIDAYAFRCSANQARITEEAQFGPDGAVTDRFPDPEAAWEDVPADSLVAYIRGVACESMRSDRTSPSIQAFIDGGRGK
ncbi:surface-adhesin E family protein [Brevundimonas sp. NPDC090276]|uniref:surface-adhesin E family protein n=1 Tax=Brevundimonas sp. NPDC090276 TaxID=3363956 RepID=UPI00383BBFCF